MSNKMITAEEVAERLNISPGQVRKFIALGMLRAINLTIGKKGSYLRVSEADLQVFIEQAAVCPTPPPAPPRRRKTADDTKQYV